MTRIIDLTPTWAGLVPAFIAVIENGTPEGRAAVREELTRMATLADLWAAHVKAESTPDAGEVARLRAGVLAAVAQLSAPHYGELETIADHAADARATLENLTTPKGV